MMLYKLLKDTPTIKAGTIFREVVSDYDGARELARVTPIRAKTNPQWTIQDINNFGEWFEEIKEPTDSIHWKPKKGEKYWISRLDGDISYLIWSGYPDDYNYYDLGRTYRTEEECIRARDRELAEARLRRTSKFNPDFKNGRGGWMVYYDHGCETLAVCELDYYDDGEVVRYKTRAAAEKSIKENERDWKIYFGIDPSDTGKS